MKKIYMYALSAMLCGGLVSSCEMKEELWGQSTNTDTGALDVAVSVAERTSRADETVSTADFPVTITNTEDASAVYSYAAYSEMPASVALPVGTYTVEAHSNLTLENQMSVPYYEGSAQFTITKDVTSQVDVVCKMKNTCVTLAYGEEFLSTFSSWTITLNDGQNRILTFTNEDAASPVVTYWLLSENVETIRMDITAFLADGTKIVDSKSFTKADAEESYDEDTTYFTGGETIAINMGVEGDETDKTDVTITVNVDLTFADKNDTVTIPVEDSTTTTPSEPVTPENPSTSDAVKLTIPDDITYSISAGDAPASADVLIETPNGLASLVVRIVSGNQDFQDILNNLSMDGQNFNDGVEVVDNSDMANLFSNTGVSSPNAGDTSYTFPISVFFTFLNATGATDAGKAHEFHIEATDSEGNTNTGVLKVYINE